MLDGKLLILLHNSFFEEWLPIPEHIATPCTYTTDRSLSENADAVVVHIPSLNSMQGLKKRKGQLWVGWFQESPSNYPVVSNPTFMQQFDLTMSYLRSSDVWHPYFDFEVFERWDQPIPPKTTSAPAVMLQRNANDRCGRVDYVAELMRAVHIDSFGDLHRNQDEVIEPGPLPRRALYSRYKMTLAFENSFSPEYVTEKLFEPLLAGSVPVYRGAAEARDLAPSSTAYIDASQFSSPRELGEYLDHLDHDDAELAKYHEWRLHPPPPSLLELVSGVRGDRFAKLARVVALRLGRNDLVDHE